MVKGKNKIYLLPNQVVIYFPTKERSPDLNNNRYQDKKTLSLFLKIVHAISLMMPCVRAEKEKEKTRRSGQGTGRWKGNCQVRIGNRGSIEEDTEKEIN